MANTPFLSKTVLWASLYADLPLYHLVENRAEDYIVTFLLESLVAHLIKGSVQ